MGNFGKSISLSISSAKTLLTIAEDAIVFIEQLDTVTTPEEISSSLTSLAKLAQEGLSATEKALTSFLDIRTTQSPVMTTGQLPSECIAARLNKLMYLSALDHADAQVLFRDGVWCYVVWWKRMKMRMAQQANGTDEINKLYSEVRKQKIADKWEKVDAESREYSNKVNEFAALSYAHTSSDSRCAFCKTNTPMYFSDCQRLGQLEARAASQREMAATLVQIFESLNIYDYYISAQITYQLQF